MLWGNSHVCNNYILFQCPVRPADDCVCDCFLILEIVLGRMSIHMPTTAPLVPVYQIWHNDFLIPNSCDILPQFGLSKRPYLPVFSILSAGLSCFHGSVCQSNQQKWLMRCVLELRIYKNVQKMNHLGPFPDILIRLGNYFITTLTSLAHLLYRWLSISTMGNKQLWQLSLFVFCLFLVIPCP